MKLTVVPLIAYPSGTSLPTRAAYEVYGSFADVREFFRRELGKTIDIRTPLTYRMPETWDQLRPQFHVAGFNLWKKILADAMVKHGRNLCDKRYAYYTLFVRPFESADTFSLIGCGGMVGVENWGCSYDRPGTAMMSDHMAWLLAGVPAETLRGRGWDVPWWCATSAAAEGALAHEIVHIVSDLPHSADSEWSILRNWWDGLHLGRLTDTEKQALIATGLFG